MTVARRSPILGLLLAVAAGLFAAGCGPREQKTGDDAQDGKSAKTEEAKVDFAALRPKIVRFCGACHAVPNPATFPKKAWYDEVAQGYRFYEESRRHDLDPPPMNSVVAYYRHFAPQRLELPRVQRSETPSPVSFTARSVPLAHGVAEPRVSNLDWQVSKGSLLFCDMQSGDVGRFRPSDRAPKIEILARCNHPARIEPVDFNRDGRPGYLVAELGTFLPGDHDKGRISWRRGRADGAGFDLIVLKAGLGRVADVRAADFDGDGKLDLIVAEFGWRKTGRILLLKQTGQKDGVPQFQTIVIDDRHGTIHVPVVDFNRDGRPDFIALVSQEHEAIDLFLNQGDGRFERKRIFEAGDPSFGSSGIQVVDLDGDGDLDVLYTNGDSLDSHYLKPYHAVHWLENRGGFPFKRHELTRLPGASRAVAVDLDGDGDLDVVCTAYLPPTIIDQQAGAKIESIIWLEQKEKGRFVRHRIDRSSSGYLSLAVGDFNGDGRPDLAAGHFGAAPGAAWVTLWTNRPATGRSMRRKKTKRGE